MADAPDTSQDAAPNTPAEQTGTEYAPILDRMDEPNRSFGERFEALEQRLPAEDAQPDYEADGGYQEDQYLQDEYGNIYDQQGNPIDPQALDAQPQGIDPQQIEQIVEQRLQAALSPVQEHILDQQVADLESRYPALQNPETAEAVVQEAERQAQAYAQSIGNPALAQSLVRNPQFVEQVFLAQRGRQQAESEIPAGAEATGIELESAAGSNPGDEQPDLADRIVNAGSSGSSFFS